MSTRERARVALGVAEGIAHLHRHSVMHRDVKPHNVLLDEACVAKVADFGIATRVGVEQPTPERGTLRYMAPEVVFAAYDFKADVSYKHMHLPATAQALF